MLAQITNIQTTPTHLFVSKNIIIRIGYTTNQNTDDLKNAFMTQSAFEIRTKVNAVA